MGLAKRLEALTNAKKHKISEKRAEKVLRRTYGEWTEQAEQKKEWLRSEQGRLWLEDKVSENQEAKAARRKAQMIAEMKRLGLHHDCKLCLMSIGHHCSLNLPDGCLDYWEVGKETSAHLLKAGNYAGNRHG